MEIVRTAVEKKRDASRLAGALLESGAAGCVLFWKAESRYFWKGKPVRAHEYIVEAKCADAARAKKATLLLEKLHPYETPMVLIAHAKADGKYQKWLARRH